MDFTTWSSNSTEQSGFILVGLFRQSTHPALLCLAIFVIFLMTLSGNVLLIFLIHSDTHLHTPMYFFISQLSLMDMMYISTTVPKMLLDQVLGENKISAPECGMQMFLYLTLVGSEFFLLAAMSYDRYMAICHPLRYAVLMSHRVCLLLASTCWFLGSVDGFMLTPVTMTFPFCGSRDIHHFFCEVPAVTKLSCSDTSLYEMLMYLCCVLMLLIPVTVISSSYTFILLTILRMNSAEGRKKALATCSSHMTVVLLFYGAAVYTYMLPSSYHSPQKDMVVSVFYTILTPVLNPLIYSLRNKDVTEALRKMCSVKIAFPDMLPALQVVRAENQLAKGAEDETDISEKFQSRKEAHSATETIKASQLGKGKSLTEFPQVPWKTQVQAGKITGLCSGLFSVRYIFESGFAVLLYCSGTGGTAVAVS
ncbi:olfactory receptor 2T29-like [Cavia porcellus]|nr:olfactory receptor 2T29-like [Cavia porcellus]